MVAREVARQPDLGIQAVGFIDDDRFKHGTTIHGIRVLGGSDRIAALADELDARSRRSCRNRRKITGVRPRMF